MKFNTITTVSMLALMMSTSAYAESVPVDARGGEAMASTAATAKDEDTTVLDDVKSGLTKADKAIRNTAEDIKVFFIGKEANSKLEPVLIQHNMTANGLIGEDVINSKGEKITKVKDVIIDKSGRAILLVVTDGGFLGIGDKVAAFDYSKVVDKKDGKTILFLSQDMIDRAADFSYDQKDFAKAKVIPTGSISVNELLKGNVLDDNGKKIANIENVYIRNSDVSQIIVGFNKTLGMGGDLAALDYDDLQMVRKDDNFDFKLNANQTEQFKNFKTSVAN